MPRHASHATPLGDGGTIGAECTPSGRRPVGHSGVVRAPPTVGAVTGVPFPRRAPTIGPIRRGVDPAARARPAWTTHGGCCVDILNDARRLATIGTVFIVVGWFFVIYALIAGVLWWWDLATSDAFNVFQAFAISSAAVGLPIFAALIVAGFGYAMRLFALYVATRSQ
jgi:hypothetical protein